MWYSKLKLQYGRAEDKFNTANASVEDVKTEYVNLIESPINDKSSKRDRHMLIDSGLEHERAPNSGSRDEVDFPPGANKSPSDALHSRITMIVWVAILVAQLQELVCTATVSGGERLIASFMHQHQN